MRVLVPPSLHWQLIWSVFVFLAISIDALWYLLCPWRLITDEAEHVLMCLFAICLYSSASVQIFCLLFLSCRLSNYWVLRILYIFKMQDHYQVSALRISRGLTLTLVTGNVRSLCSLSYYRVWPCDSSYSWNVSGREVCYFGVQPLK